MAGVCGEGPAPSVLWTPTAGTAPRSLRPLELDLSQGELFGDKHQYRDPSVWSSSPELQKLPFPVQAASLGAYGVGCKCTHWSGSYSGLSGWSSPGCQGAVFSPRAVLPGPLEVFHCESVPAECPSYPSLQSPEAGGWGLWIQVRMSAWDFLGWVSTLSQLPQLPQLLPAPAGPGDTEWARWYVWPGPRAGWVEEAVGHLMCVSNIT